MGPAGDLGAVVVREPVPVPPSHRGVQKLKPRPRVPKTVPGGGAVAERQWDPPGAWLRGIARAPLPVASPQESSPPALHAPLKG